MSNRNNKSDLQQKVESLQQRVTHLETALLESERRFRILTESAPVGIYLNDAQGKAIYINDKCAEIVGVPAEKALNFNWIPFLHPDDREEVVTRWQKAFTNSEPFHFEYRYVHADGKIVWTLGEAVPVLGDDGKATMFVGTLTDITARKEAELKKEELEAQLMQAQKMESIGRLAGGVAHDYNNMLGVIISYTELAMMEVEAGSSVYKRLEKILDAAERSAEITRQLLGFARKQVLLPKVFELNGAVKELLNMVKRLIGEDIELVWSPQAEQIPIRMDPSQLDQIVFNLCINARDAIDDVGRIVIETGVVVLEEAEVAERRRAVPGEFVLLSVSDNGRGMDQATRERIFEPFFTTKKQDKGTGLGLASVYGIVKQNKGFIEVVSEINVGSTLRIYLPVYSGKVVEEEAADSDIVYQSVGQTILIVEDEVVVLEAVKQFLSDFAYNILTANTPAEALRLARYYEIDLLITDVIMPKMNGRDLAEKIRLSWPNLQCLYMSGYTADMIADKGVLEEQLNFIQKPFRRKAFVEKVGEMLK